MKISELFRIKLSDILANCQFWYATLVVYYQFRNIPTEQIFLLLSFYSICAFAFEYPTGVISDYFSPKISLICGYLLSAVCMFLQSFPGNIYYYGLLLMMSAVGFTLTSGSDTSLLHAASKNFKNDYSQVKMWGLIMSAISASVGGLTGAYDLRYPLYLTSFFFVLSTILLLFIGDYSYKNDDANIFSTATEGIKHVLSNKKLYLLMLIACFVGIFIISFKFFFNPFFQEIKLPLPVWGLFISISILFSALGIRIYKSFGWMHLNYSVALFILAIFIMGISWIPIVALAGFFLCYLIRGYLETQLDVMVNEAISSRARASVLSLKSVIIRIGQSGYTFLGGMIIAKASFFPFMLITSGLLILGCMYPLYRIKYTVWNEIK